MARTRRRGDEARRPRFAALRRPDVIVLPTGTSGTLAAIALGCAWLGWKTRVVGVRITALVACNAITVRLLAGATARFLAKHDPAFDRARVREPRIELFHRA